MEVKVYIGGHEATTKHFISALKENKDALDAENIACFPAEENTFHSIFKASKAIRQGGDIETIRTELLQQLTGVQNINKLLIVDYRVTGQKHRAFEKEPFFPRAKGFIKQLQVIFQTYDMRIFIETRDLATYIPSCYSNRIFSNVSSSLEDFLTTISIEDLRWSEYIERAQGHSSAPIPATVWRYEDYPYIWRDVLGAMTRIPKYQDLLNATTPFDFNDNLQMALLLYKYTQKYPIKTDDEFEKLKELFLEHNPATIRKITIPDWSTKRTEALTDSYDDDWYYIERMENVEIIKPLT